MNLRKLTSWFPELSYRQKVVSLILSGVIVGLGGLFFYLLRMQTYLIGDDPAACVNCHIMTFTTPRGRTQAMGEMQHVMIAMYHILVLLPNICSREWMV